MASELWDCDRPRVSIHRETWHGEVSLATNRRLRPRESNCAGNPRACPDRPGPPSPFRNVNSKERSPSFAGEVYLLQFPCGMKEWCGPKLCFPEPADVKGAD